MKRGQSSGSKFSTTTAARVSRRNTELYHIRLIAAGGAV